MVNQSSTSACSVCFVLSDSALEPHEFKYWTVEPSNYESNRCETCIRHSTQHLHKIKYAELEDTVREGCETCFVVMEGIKKVLNSISPKLKPSGAILGSLVEGHPFVGVDLLFEGPTEIDIRIEFYSVGDSPSPWDKLQVTSHIDPPEPPPVSNLDAAIEWMKHELEECVANHPGCTRTPKDEKINPSRLLDLHPGLPDDSVRLTHTGDGFDAPYTALSHCWGETRLITTTKASLSDRLREIKVTDLPKTFQDAIRITRNLDVGYLWIDSLCIVQDDSKDWEIESRKMGAIYSGSYLKIAAVSSKNSSDGCIPEFTSSYFKIGAKGGDDQIVYARYTPSKRSKNRAHNELTGLQNPLGVPLLSRGWVFQERILSPYMAHFHESDLFYECKSSLHCRCGKTHYKAEKTLSEVRPELEQVPSGKLVETWEEIVSSYSILLLTNQQDKLPALSGIASVFSTNFGESQYLAGLWENLLPQTFLWHHDNLNDYLRNSVSNISRVYLAPSWSWASINRPVRFSHFGKAHTDFTILDIWCHTPGENPYGLVVDGQLKLRGIYLESPTLDISDYSRSKNVKSAWLCLRFPQLGFHLRFWPDDIESCLSLENATVVPWTVILVAHNDRQDVSLVLRKSETVPGSYVRVGLGESSSARDKDHLWRKDEPTKVFTII